MFTIRSYVPEDTEQMVQLFYNTVHTINKADYNKQQLDAWAPLYLQAEQTKQWTQAFTKRVTIVAEAEGHIIGFTDLTREGYLDRLYVHSDWQRRGVASALLHHVEQEANKRELTLLHTASSITALPFFLAHQFTVVREQEVLRDGVSLKNYVMHKRL